MHASKPATRPAPRLGWGVSIALHLAVLGAALAWRVPGPPPPADEDMEPIAIAFAPAPYRPAAPGLSADRLPMMELSSADIDLAENAPATAEEEDPPAVAGRPDISAARELGGESLTLCLGAGGGAQGKSGRLRGGGGKRGGGCGGGSEGGLIYQTEYQRVPARLVFELLIFPAGTPQARAMWTSSGEEYVTKGSLVDSLVRTSAIDALYPHSTNRSEALFFFSLLDRGPGAEWRCPTPAPRIPAVYPWLRLVVSPIRGHLLVPKREVGAMPSAGADGRGYMPPSRFMAQHRALDDMLELARSYGLDPHWIAELSARDMPSNVIRHVVMTLAGLQMTDVDAIATPWSCPPTKADLATWAAQFAGDDSAGRGALAPTSGSSPVHSP